MRRSVPAGFLHVARGPSLAGPTQLSQADHAGIGEVHNLSPTGAIAALDSRIAALAGQITEYTALLADAHRRNVDDISVLYGSYATSQQQREREWMTSLRAQIQTGDLTWPTPT